MATKADHDRRILDGALRIAVREGWHAASLAAIADEAGVPLLELYRRYPSRTAVLAALLGATDEAVLHGSKPDLGEPARDRLFDVLMRRFDALRPRKEAVGAILRSLTSDPVSLACLWPHFIRSMGWMLVAAGLDSAGLGGALRAKGLAVIYLSSLRVWLKDETADLAPTMAAVDRGLRRAEATVGWCARIGRGVRERAASSGGGKPGPAKTQGKARRRRRR